ncbi:MAG: TPR end-of-group domain-containing protein [Dongiales bacterium]
MAIDPDDPLDHYNLGCSLARMNKPDQALDLLEACAAKMSPEWIDWVKQDSDLISLHNHPRYKALIARGEASLAALRKDKAAETSVATVPLKSA